MAYMHRHGPARNLCEMLAQEGRVMALAGCSGPTLDAEDIAYTREVLIPHLGTDDMRTCIECLFGDAAARTLGFTPRGLSPWAGLALALHDARPNLSRAWGSAARFVHDTMLSPVPPTRHFKKENSTVPISDFAPELATHFSCGVIFFLFLFSFFFKAVAAEPAAAPPPIRATLPSPIVQPYLVPAGVFCW
jgi:hypothetical protein